MAESCADIRPLVLGKVENPANTIWVSWRSPSLSLDSAGHRCFKQGSGQCPEHSRERRHLFSSMAGTKFAIWTVMETGGDL